MDTLLPRLLSIVLLVTSIAMLVPIGAVVIDLASGVQLPPARWVVPLAILASAAIMMWLLTRKGIPLQLYLAAFALWVLTAGYFLFTTRALTTIH